MITSSTLQPKKDASLVSRSSRSNASTLAASPSSATSIAKMFAVTLSATNSTLSGPKAIGPTPSRPGVPTCRPCSLMAIPPGPRVDGAYAAPADPVVGHGRIAASCATLSPMETMPAIVYVGDGAIELRRVEVPELGPDQVRIAVSHCGICGTDLHLVLENMAPARIGPRSRVGGHHRSGGRSGHGLGAR